MIIDLSAARDRLAESVARRQRELAREEEERARHTEVIDDVTDAIRQSRAA